MLTVRLSSSALCAFTLAAAWLVSIARAEVTLPHLLSDHAVLQRDMPVHIWGHADPDEKISVTFHGQQGQTEADKLGRWSLFLQPEHAGGPYTLTVAGTNTITLHDVLVGDVWFASGQSNMQLPLKGFGPDTPLKNSAGEIAAANHPMIHLLHVKNVASDYEQRDQDAIWTVCSPDTVPDFSAVAYFFGRETQEKQHTPIGLIEATWGGTPIAPWISLDGLAADASLMPEFAARVPMVEDEADLPARGAEEQREDAAAKAAGQPLPKHPWHPQPDSYAPAGIFNGMVAPLTDYTIKGVLWYQGETDSSAERGPLYERAFPALITDWRARWHEGDFPFLFVQISSFTSVPAETWGVVREAQRRTLKLRDTAMVVSLDVGQADNVHPADKQTVGHRLALAAQAIAYGERIEYSGPLFREAVPEGTSMRVYFTHAEGGLHVRKSGQTSAQPGELHGFEVAGEDGRFHAATAHIAGDAVIVQGTDGTTPKYVRYAWTNSALSANLYNNADLPASTFTSQDHIPAPCRAGCDE